MSFTFAILVTILCVRILENYNDSSIKTKMKQEFFKLIPSQRVLPSDLYFTTTNFLNQFSVI